MAHEPIEKFWMVWGVQRGMPRHRHATKELAQAEAKRLANLTPGELFVVLAAVDAVVSPILPAERVPLVKPTGDLKPMTADEMIPF